MRSLGFRGFRSRWSKIKERPLSTSPEKDKIPPGIIIPSDHHAARVDTLLKTGVLTSGALTQAVRALNPGPFLDLDLNHISSQQTIDAVLHDQCAALEALETKLQPGAAVMDVGCGTGYVTSLLGLLVTAAGSSPQPGFATGVDRVQDLVESVPHRIARAIAPHMQGAHTVYKSVVLCPADAHQGFMPKGPFDAIHVWCALERASLDRLLKGDFKQKLVDSDFEDLDVDLLRVLAAQMKPGALLVAPFACDHRGTQLVRVARGADDKKTFTADVLDHVKLKKDHDLAEKGISVGEESEAAKQKRKAIEKERDRVKAQLDQWTQSFQNAQGRKPNRQDLLQDDHARTLFSKFSKLNSL